MDIKKRKKTNPWKLAAIFFGTFYVTLRLASACTNGFSFEALKEVSEGLNLFDLSALVLSRTNLSYAFCTAIFFLCASYAKTIGRKATAFNRSHGNAKFAEPKEADPYKEKDIVDNMILTKNVQVAKNMKVSQRNRNVVLVGRPGTGKSRYFFKPNILNATGTIIVTDPKGELLRDCGYSLKQKGYTIKVLNLDKKTESNRYNCLNYIKKVDRDNLSEKRRKLWTEDSIAEDDVMSLIDCIFKNTQGDVDTKTGDPFWEKAEMMFLQALFYYVLLSGKYSKEDQNFNAIMSLIEKAKPKTEDGGGDADSELNGIFQEWEKELIEKGDENNIGLKQWKLFQNSAGSPKTMSTIVLTASARLAAMNIAEISELVSTDDMELERIGKAGSEGRIAYFIITKPGDSAFNFLANIFYSQVFKMIDYNAFLNHGSCATNVDLYMDEWAQLGEIPRFVEQLAYVRGLNCGVVIGLQSLSQLKKVYKDSWETALDCCDYKILMGSESEETLKYFSSLMGKETIIEQDESKGKNKSKSLKEIGSDLATIDQLRRMEKGKCILMMSSLNAFYDEMYDLSSHPLYDQLYEPWNKKDPKNAKKLYAHGPSIKAYQRYQKNKELCKAVGVETKSAYEVSFKNPVGELINVDGAMGFGPTKMLEDN